MVMGGDPFFSKTWTKGHWPPRWPLTSGLLTSHVWLYPRIIMSKSHENTKVCGYSLPFFSKTWTKGHWPLDDLWPHICWGHMCHSTQGSIVSKSHGNTSMLCGYNDQFCKIPHTYYIHTSITTYYLGIKYQTWNGHKLENALGVQNFG